MTAAAPAPKKREHLGLSEFARRLGSTKGVDPIPPDQYLYFLGKKEPPLQRLLALVRACTIQRGRWSEYCVDEKGKPLRLADLERLLEMEHGNFKRTLREAVSRGLIRVGPGEASQNRSGHNSRHPERVYLCGTVKESIGYEQGEEKGGVCTDSSSHLSPMQRKILAGWPQERKDRFYAEFVPAVKYKKQLEAEAIAQARHIGDRALDQVFSAHSLPKIRLATQPPQPQLIQLTLSGGSSSMSTQLDGSVQTPSVQTRADESVPTEKRGSVLTSASLLSSDNYQRTSVGRLVESNLPTNRTPSSEPKTEAGERIRRILLTEYGKRFPGSHPDDEFCSKIHDSLKGAPLENLVSEIHRRMKAATGMGFALTLAKDVGRRWAADAATRVQNEAALRKHQAEENERMRVGALETLNDPRADAEEKANARRLLEYVSAEEKANAAGGGR